ncbi:MAG: hypothetical protein PVI71_15990 [Desulfobacterales bacterium]
MGARDDKQDDLAAFHSGPLEDLTLQDALIISAVYAVQADPEICQKISALAQKHPLFVEQPKDTSARVNKFANFMQQAKLPLQAIEAVSHDLNPEHRKQAFEFAIEAALIDGELTQKKKEILQTLATRLALEDEFVQRKLAKWQSNDDQ